MSKLEPYCDECGGIYNCMCPSTEDRLRAACEEALSWFDGCSMNVRNAPAAKRVIAKLRAATQTPDAPLVNLGLAREVDEVWFGKGSGATQAPTEPETP